MKIVIIGYGKMGRTIERLAMDQGHEIVGYIDIHTTEKEKIELMQTAEVGIEFSRPEAAFQNISQALYNDLPTVSGTTGWLENFEKIEVLVAEKNGAFFYASNFSIGVNLFWKMNQKLAEVMNSHPAYTVSMEEVHHVHKKDEPSGTAITTAEQIINSVDSKSEWTLASVPENHQIGIQSIRKGEVFGIHKVRYSSTLDTIQLHHEAFTRDGFALGAIEAAQWLIGKKGVFGMSDMLEI